MTSLRGHGKEKGERKEGALGSWKKSEVEEEDTRTEGGKEGGWEGRIYTDERRMRGKERTRDEMEEGKGEYTEMKGERETRRGQERR